MPIIPSRLPPNEVHVWALRTAEFVAQEQFPKLAAMLSARERQTAQRFRSRQLTEQYIQSHALVRRVLSNYIKAPPGEIKIMADSMARPYLAHQSELDFNLSHTDGMSVVAVTRDVVGIDIERLRNNIDARALACRVLSARESATIPDGVAASQTPFFDYWTLKESYAKAIGLGLRVEFRDIEVSLSEPLTVSLNDDYDDCRHWIFRLYGCDEYRLAIAVRRQSVADVTVHLVETNCELEPLGLLAMDLLKTTDSMTYPTYRPQRESESLCS